MFGRRHRASSCATIAAFIATVPSLALAEVAYKIDVPAQELGNALRSIGRQTSTNVIFEPALVKGLKAGGIHAELTVEEAIRQLLIGTRLAARRTSADTIVVQREPESPPARPTPSNAASSSAESDVSSGGPQTTAANSAGGAESAGVEEIIVTAQKRAESIQDVPISISAVTADQIASRGVASLQDMQYSIPGLSSFRYGPGGQEYIQLRGISNSSGAQTVGQYLDEVPIISDSQGQSLDIRLLDMERVEVLRGPQATLYGEGSMGGTIRYITASPDLYEFSGAFEGETGSVTDGGWDYKANGMLNVPIVDGVVGARIVAGYERDAGWIDNDLSGEDDTNDASIRTLRGKIAAKLGERGTFSLLALHQDSEQDYQNFGFDRHSGARVPQFNRDDYEVYNAVFQYDLGGVDFTGSVGYIDRHQDRQADNTDYFSPVLGSIGIPAGLVTLVRTRSSNDFEALANEFRLSSRNAGRLNWSIGAYLRQSESFNGMHSTASPAALPFEIYVLDQHRESSAWAVFGEATYDLTDRLTLIVGARYYEDQQKFKSFSETFGAGAVDVGEATFDSLNPRVNLRYMPSSTSTYYANVSKGFRSGGFNQTSLGGGIVTIPPTYDPDELWSYEIGSKQQFFGRKLDLDVAAYYNDWQDVQSPSIVPLATGFVTINGGHVQGLGVDLSMTVRPVRGLALSATYGWNNLEFQSATADKIEGDPVDFAVRQSWSASADYRAPLSASVEGIIRVDYQHVGEAHLTQRAFGQVQTFPEREMLGLRAGVVLGELEIVAFATNVLDETAPLVPPIGALVENTELQPRTVGVNVKTRF
jgi:outer membrane receptor protein involved in Fe transport